MVHQLEGKAKRRGDCRDNPLPVIARWVERPSREGCALWVARRLDVTEHLCYDLVGPGTAGGSFSVSTLRVAISSRETAMPAAQARLDMGHTAAPVPGPSPSTGEACPEMF